MGNPDFEIYRILFGSTEMLSRAFQNRVCVFRKCSKHQSNVLSVFWLDIYEVSDFHSLLEDIPEVNYSRVVAIWVRDREALKGSKDGLDMSLVLKNIQLQTFQFLEN